MRPRREIPFSAPGNPTFDASVTPLLRSARDASARSETVSFAPSAGADGFFIQDLLILSRRDDPAPP